MLLCELSLPTCSPVSPAMHPSAPPLPALLAFNPAIRLSLYKPIAVLFTDPSVLATSCPLPQVVMSTLRCQFSAMLSAIEPGVCSSF